VLAGHPQSHPARDEHLQHWTCGEERGDQRSGCNDVFKIVQHEENVPIAEVALEPIDDLSFAALRHAESLRDGGDNECRIGERCQIDEDGAIGKERCHIVSNGERKTRLTYSARSGQSQ
jgi:hypothetical protein